MLKNKWTRKDNISHYSGWFVIFEPSSLAPFWLTGNSLPNIHFPHPLNASSMEEAIEQAEKKLVHCLESLLKELKES